MPEDTLASLPCDAGGAPEAERCSGGATTDRPVREIADTSLALLRPKPLPNFHPRASREAASAFIMRSLTNLRMSSAAGVELRGLLRDTPKLVAREGDVGAWLLSAVEPVLEPPVECASDEVRAEACVVLNVPARARREAAEAEDVVRSGSEPDVAVTSSPVLDSVASERLESLIVLTKSTALASAAKLSGTKMDRKDCIDS